MVELIWLARATKAIALLLGAFIVYLAYKGYKRNNSKPMEFVALGFSLITAGTVLEGLFYEILGQELLAAIAVGTGVTVVGFLTIIYSIYSVK